MRVRVRFRIRVRVGFRIRVRVRFRVRVRVGGTFERSEHAQIQI